MKERKNAKRAYIYAVMRQSVWCIEYRVNGRYGINGITHFQSISAKTTTTTTFSEMNKER